MKFLLPPCKRTIIPPPNGWKPRTYYTVEVAWTEHNVIHKAVFYTGFLNGPNGEPGGYNQIWNPTYDRPVHYNNLRQNHSYEFGLERVHYLKAVCELPSLERDDEAGAESEFLAKE